MDITPASLRIGDRLVLGKYGVRNDSPQPLIWLKASPNCGFITEYIPDYLCFDAKEPGNENRDIQYNGNSNYALSNVHSFLNSDEENWFHPTHDYDAAPNRRQTNTYGEYESHYGFPYHFEEYEIDSLMLDCVEVAGQRVQSLVRLPLISEISGADRFRLFSKRGIRPKGTDDMVHGRRVGFDYNSYIDYWVLGDEPTRRNRSFVHIVSRNSSLDATAPSTQCGIRPVCKLKPDTLLTLGEDGMYYIKPRTIQHNICTEDELISFLGIAQP